MSARSAPGRPRAPPDRARRRRRPRSCVAAVLWLQRERVAHHVDERGRSTLDRNVARSSAPGSSSSSSRPRSPTSRSIAAVVGSGQRGRDPGGAARDLQPLLRPAAARDPRRCGRSPASARSRLLERIRGTHRPLARDARPRRSSLVVGLALLGDRRLRPPRGLSRRSAAARRRARSPPDEPAIRTHAGEREREPGDERHAVVAPRSPSARAGRTARARSAGTSAPRSRRARPSSRRGAGTRSCSRSSPRPPIASPATAHDGRVRVDGRGRSCRRRASSRRSSPRSRSRSRRSRASRCRTACRGRRRAASPAAESTGEDGEHGGRRRGATSECGGAPQATSATPPMIATTPATSRAPDPLVEDPHAEHEHEQQPEREHRLDDARTAPARTRPPAAQTPTQPEHEPEQPERPREEAARAARAAGRATAAPTRASSAWRTIPTLKSTDASSAAPSPVSVHHRESVFPPTGEK